ncbi:hypothetical protein AB6A40_011496 [Gnathostoma spinigerum]|uniref:Uncharacterized protein n=1 Tax=Gnathostoma spinigerum TaxID=75299 RepID=A0ABD6F4F4_9BILA
MKMSNKFILTPPAPNCPPFTANLKGQGEGYPFLVDPSRAQIVREWESRLGDFGVISPNVTTLRALGSDEWAIT